MTSEGLVIVRKKVQIHQMEFNTSKCEFLIVTNKMSPPKFTYHFNDVPFKEENSVKYLGVIIDSKLTWISKYCQKLT